MLDTTAEPRTIRRSRRRDGPSNEAIRGLVDRLQRTADERVMQRANIEKRWLEDLRQYHGQNLQDTKIDAERSSMIMNITRTATNWLAAQMFDMMFPTDDRNWAISPSPVPEMDRTEERLQGVLDEAEQALSDKQSAFREASERLPIDDEAARDEVDGELIPLGQAVDAAEASVSEAQAALDGLREIRAEARRRADLMQDEIDDQLKACGYQPACRDVIDDACKLGTGVMKGPVLGGRTYKRWTRGEDGIHALIEVQDLRPSFQRVDPWGFFPELDAKDPMSSEGIFERHLLNKKQLRKLQRRDDMDDDALREVLKDDPAETAPSGMSELFSITGDEAYQIKGKYQVWEYTGIVEPEDLATLADVYDDIDVLSSLQDIDPLSEVHAKVWFCNNEVLSFALHPMDSGEPIYSVFNIEKSETSMFGYGIPAMGRDPQSAFSAAWRAMMDNARVASGPQVVINKRRIEAADGSGDYSLNPFKVWNDTGKAGDSGAPFSTFDIPMNQALLANIIIMAKEAFDQVVGLPSGGQDNVPSGKEESGLRASIRVNQANVGIRRIVRNFDDDLTVPNIRRIYDFNMQFSTKDEIKGDYEVDARGSSSLLVREMQAPNLMALAQMFGENPRYEGRINEEEMLRQMFRALMVPADTLVRTEKEYRAYVEEKAEQSKGDPEMALKQEEMSLKREEIEARISIAEMETDARQKVAQLNYDAAMEKVVGDLNERDEDRQEKREAREVEAAMKDRALNVEVGMAQRTGKSAGGSV